VFDDYRLSLHAAGKSKATQAVYTLAVRYLDDYLREQGMPTALGAIRREHVEAWLGSLRDPGKAKATVSVYFRSLQAFFRWTIEEGFVGESPLRNIARPNVPDQPIPVLSLEQLRALLKDAEGPASKTGAIRRSFACSPTPASGALSSRG
jgi:site-specific recombinase XerD